MAMRTFNSARLAYLKLDGVKFNVAVAMLATAGDVTRRFVWRVAHGFADALVET